MATIAAIQAKTFPGALSGACAEAANEPQLRKKTETGQQYISKRCNHVDIRQLVDKLRGCDEMEALHG
jgi:hypothetical protein